MINRQQLLGDLQSVLRSLESDLLDRTDSSEVPEVGEWLREEYQRAKDAERTAHTQKQWMDDFITQVAAAWVLSCVFARFLEDNELVDPPRIAGPGKRLDGARDEYTLFFQDAERAKLTNREYLLDIFEGLAKLPAGKDVFGPHNPMNAMPNWLGPDAAGELLRFFQKIDSASGELVHDFTDPEWDTRFLGDLYQDLSEAARKKYALLQTPEFVEEFILDRTLDPALDEFGLTPESDPDGRFRIIDPACGSGHFLLGAFPRILNRWQKQEPGTNVRELVQRTLNSIHGVDINPFAIAIARFRLLLAALQASDVRRLVDAPAFHMNLACGDSLYHGRQRQQTLGDWTDESHYFRTEDAENLRRILQEGTFHSVVANPPYITPKDKAANNAYRKLYPKTCHRQYSLSVPFMERIFRLAVCGAGHNGDTENTKKSRIGQAGFIGQITGNSFMKREFGKKLIESFFPTVDLTHVIDTSLAYIPAHGTPTLIAFGRNRRPLLPVVRSAMGITCEDEQPKVPAEGKVWSSIRVLIDDAAGENEFITVRDTPRDIFHEHPWTLAGGGTADLKAALDSLCELKLSGIVERPIGRAVRIAEEDAFIFNSARKQNSKCLPSEFREYLIGEVIRDWSIGFDCWVWYPYCDESTSSDQIRQLWQWRTRLANRSTFQGKMADAGRVWWEYMQHTASAYQSPLSIAFAFMVTHNQFVLDRGNRVFQQSAPVVKLPIDSSENDHLELLGCLNSSIGCFWMKNVFYDKGGGGIGGGIAAEAWERFMAMDGTKLEEFPLPANRPSVFAGQLDQLARRIETHSAGETLAQRRKGVKENDRSDAFVPLRETLSTAHVTHSRIRGEMIRLQEELDWQCYNLYGLIEGDFISPHRHGDDGEDKHENSAPLWCNLPINLGERAFEIVLARKMARGEVQTTWFERHVSTPITELPEHWPDDYKQLVERRMEVIETNPQITLIERPEYKRRWNTEPWNSQVERALRSWLLDRLESYFGLVGRMNEEGNVAAKIDISLTSVAKLADIARQDNQFMEVAEVYRDDPAFDVTRLIEELVQSEHVPLLPILRYKPNGLRNRAEWGKTWELQRLEDKLRAGDAVNLYDYELTDMQNEDIATWRKDTPAEQRSDDRGLDTILAILVPPKYKSSDFISSGGSRYWSLRGKLDVPKERWVSFPHCEGPDGTLMIAWAGYNHLQLAQAISAYYVDVQERLGGRDDPRLIPLLAGVIELLPWLRQWHHEIDPEYNQRMDEVYEGFVTEEAKALNLTIEEIKAWQPPKKSPKKRKASNK